MRRLIHAFTISFAVLVSFLSGGSSIKAQIDSCTSEQQDLWQTTAMAVFLDYNTAIQVPGEIQRVAELQALRRRLDEASQPACSESAYMHLLNALNLMSDSVIASYLNDDALASELVARAQSEYNLAGVEFMTDGEPVDAAITIPEDGEIVPSHQVVIRGTYNPELYGDTKDHQLWIFVIPPNQTLFPQPVNDGCDATARATLSYRPDGTWVINALLGTPVLGRGETFEVMLVSGDLNATQAVWDVFDNDWCPRGDYRGLTSEQVFTEMGFQQIQSIFLTRAP